jgi:hypothetical protein
VRQIHGVAQAGRRLRRASAKPVKQFLIYLNRTRELAGVGGVVRECAERRVHCGTWLDLFRRIEFELSEARKGGIQPLPGSGWTAQAPHWIAGTGQRSDLIPLQVHIAAGIGQVAKRVIIYVKRAAGVRVTQDTTHGDCSHRQMAPRHVIVCILVHKIVRDAEGVFQGPYCVFGPAHTDQVVSAENSTLVN